MSARMPIPSRKRCLELGAAFIEADLHRMRQEAVRRQEAEDRNVEVLHESRRYPGPITTSHEGDLMQAVEWATAAATLRCLAEREDA